MLMIYKNNEKFEYKKLKKLSKANIGVTCREQSSNVFIII